MHSLLGYEAAPTPRILWVELTSKCPVDCVFCSRKTRRGAGEHLPYALFEKLAGEIRDARKFILNYSGESTVYPHLMEAIQRARRTGACARPWRMQRKFTRNYASTFRRRRRTGQSNWMRPRQHAEVSFPMARTYIPVNKIHGKPSTSSPPVMSFRARSLTNN